MRSFWIKAINLLFILGILFAYQRFAVNREKAVAAYQTRLAEVKKEEAAGSSQYEDGTYEGSGTGFGGQIHVRIRIEAGIIQSADITEAENETPEYLSSAENILKDVIAAQSADVDTVSGATLSSRGILAAVSQALEKAGSKEEGGEEK